jgi:hypothetical protein
MSFTPKEGYEGGRSSTELSKSSSQKIAKTTKTVPQSAIHVHAQILNSGFLILLLVEG